MHRRVVVILGIATVLAAAALANTPDRPSDKTLKAIGHGRGLYLTHCTACHGTDAHGGFVGTDHQPAPDLTLIAVRDGTFDQIHVMNHVSGAFRDKREMPRYERYFASRGTGQGYAAGRVYALVQYLDFIQEPATGEQK